MDIRELLQKAEEPSPELDEAIRKEILKDEEDAIPIWNCTTDYTAAIYFVEHNKYDWIMGNVNGHAGGTPYACVGVPEDRASFSATPLLSLWLSYFRLIQGDERT